MTVSVKHATPGTLDVDTVHGPARVHLHPVEEPLGVLVLGHGAAGGVTAPDLIAATDAAGTVGFTVALVEQPYRVAARRSPPPAQQLDRAWTEVIEHLRATELDRLPLVIGGRSSGARVACRTATVAGAIGVICLAFPLQPPRRAGTEPAPSRLPELDHVTIPTLVVQGARDPFGIPPAKKHRQVIIVPGDHNLKTDLGAVAAAIQTWLVHLLPRAKGTTDPSTAGPGKSGE
jgi:predicted alpha/beta-hydrolase family hydrolase